MFSFRSRQPVDALKGRVLQVKHPNLHYDAVQRVAHLIEVPRLDLILRLQGPVLREVLRRAPGAPEKELPLEADEITPLPLHLVVMCQKFRQVTAHIGKENGNWLLCQTKILNRLNRAILACIIHFSPSLPLTEAARLIEQLTFHFANVTVEAGPVRA